MLGKSGGVEEMLLVLSHSLEEARGGRSEASSRIRVVMVNFHPCTGKPRCFLQTLQALCRRRASPAGAIGQASIGVYRRAAGCVAAAHIQLESEENATLSCCDCAVTCPSWVGANHCP